MATKKIATEIPREERYVTRKQFLEIAQIGESTGWRILIKDKKIPIYRIGRKILIKLTDIDAFMETQKERHGIHTR